MLIGEVKKNMSDEKPVETSEEDAPETDEKPEDAPVEEDNPPSSE